MSDFTAAVLILPVLFGLVVALECGRVGCTRLARMRRRADRGLEPQRRADSQSLRGTSL